MIFYANVREEIRTVLPPLAFEDDFIEEAPSPPNDENSILIRNSFGNTLFNYVIGNLR